MSHKATSTLPMISTRHAMQGANLSPPDQAGNHSTMERIAARIPGTTEYEVPWPAKSIWTHLTLDTLSVTTPVSLATDVAT